MPVQFGSALSQISTDWTTFKSVVTAKGLSIQYVQDLVTYTIFAFDGPLAYLCCIWLGEVPDGVINSGYSQAQNDADKTDFETNYKPIANSRLVRTDRFGGNVQTPFQFLSSQGVVPGLSSGLVPGYVSTASASAVAVRATTYTPGTSNARRSLKSTSANDTNTGTGARTVKITYFDQALNGPFYITVTLNGTTAVDTSATDICFIEHLEVVTSGSGTSNVGVVTLYSATGGGGGSAMGSIAIGDNRTFWAHHYVPPGVTCFLFGLRCGASAVAGSSFLAIQRNPCTPPNPMLNVSGYIRHGAAGSLMVDVDWDIPIAVPGPCLVVAMEKPDTTTASVAHTGFDYIQF